MLRAFTLSGRALGRRRTLSLDTTVPALLLKIGHYPIHHGSVAAVRSLGRLGVPVYAFTEDRFTPTTYSRYLRRALRWRTSGAEDPQELVATLLAFTDLIGARAVLIPTDDEAALLAAEHAPALSERLILPRIEPTLPRTLASKGGLADLCRTHDVATPLSGVPGSLGELHEIAAAIGFPVILKNDEPWLRLRNPAVSSSTLVHDDHELARIAARWPSMPSVLVQEYLPRNRSEDWIAHAYISDDPESDVVFTGFKMRSWPPHAGVTAVAESAWHPELAEMTGAFCRAIGFRGIADLDWRLDTRDRRFRLLDFNPRLGAQFAMFETAAGVDVVRAQHLDLTGRSVPPGPQVEGRRFIVEHLAMAAALAYRRSGAPGGREGPPPGGTKLAWFEADDPVPALVAGVRSWGPMGQWLARELHPLRRAPRGDRAED